MTTQSSSNGANTQDSTPFGQSLATASFKNLKIGTKVILGFGILVVLIFLSAGVSYLGSGRATRQINRTTDVRAPTALDASRAQADLLRMLADVRGYLALGDQLHRDSYVESSRAFEADLLRLEARAQDLDAENQRRLVELRDAYQAWAELPEQLFELRDDQLEREPAYRLLATDGVRYAGQALIATNTLIELQGQREPTAENLALMGDMAKFQGNFAAMLSALRGYATTRNRIYRGEYEVNLADNQNYWERLSDKRQALTATQRELLDTIGENRDAFLELPDQIFPILESERWREDLYLFSTQAVPLADTMQQLLAEMTSDQQARLSSELDQGRQDLATTNRLILASGVIALLFGMAMTYIARETIARPVRRLTDVAEQIRAGDLAAQAAVESRDEIGILATTFNSMTSQLRQTLLQVRKEKRRADDLLEVVIPIGVELASEKDFNRLLEKMLLEAQSFCHADAGTLYLRSSEANQLEYVIVRSDTQDIALGGTTGREVPFEPLALYDEAGTPNNRNLAVRAALDRSSVNIPHAAQAVGFDFGPDDRTGVGQATSLLAIPLENTEGNVLGVMQLMDAKDPETDHLIPFDENLQRMMESFSSLAVAALQAYIREQSLRQQIQQLRIEIDQAKKERQVAEITETGYFQELKEKAKKLRSLSEDD